MLMYLNNCDYPITYVMYLIVVWSDKIISAASVLS